MVKFRTTLGVATIVAVGGALAGGYAQMSVTINGKAPSKAILVQSGEVYVAASALKDAGAEVVRSGNRMTIRFIPPAGANQMAATEGGLDEWLSNGPWRVKVSNLRNESGVWKLDVEFRNATSGMASASAYGFDEFIAYDEAGAALQTTGSFGSEWSYLVTPSYPAGGGTKRTLGFFGDGSVKPAKAIIVVKPKLDKKYQVKAPSFRIKLG